MRPAFLILIFSILSSFCYSKDIWLGYSNDSAGNKMQWLVTSERLTETPSWNGEDKLPFKYSEYIKLARRYIKTKFPEYKNLPVHGFYLQIADRSQKIEGLENKWFITISFGGDIIAEVDGKVRILLDGTVVEPIIKGTSNK